MRLLRFCAVIFAWLVPVLFSLHFLPPPAPVFSQDREDILPGGQRAVTFTTRITQPTPFTFSLQSLGYGEVTLHSPYGSADFVLQLPENWAVRSGGTLNLRFNYTYAPLDRTIPLPDLFGEMTVSLDGEPLQTFHIRTAQLEDYSLLVDLPATLLNNPARPRHTLNVSLDASFLCDTPHVGKLQIDPQSTVALLYTTRRITPDLSLYPRPFYQRSFTPDRLYFVVPARADTRYVEDALAIAARLGFLSDNRLSITATTDLEVMTAPAIQDGEHMLVLGTPDENELVPLLSRLGDLPASLHPRRLALSMQGPASVAPGDTATYRFTVTNTLSRAVNLNLTDALPLFARRAGCQPDCLVTADGRRIVWAGQSLAAGQTTSFTLRLSLSEALTDTMFQHTLTLTDPLLGPLNAGTLTASVTMESPQTSPPSRHLAAVEQGTYFFVWEGLAVPAEDGVVQEIVSPWNEGRAILLATGLTRRAVARAVRALSSANALPGMQGTVMLVKDTRPLSPEEESPLPAERMTLADLGYDDRLLIGQGTHRATFALNVPPSWSLSEEAAAELFFSHSQSLDYARSGASVLFNQRPVASITFDETTATNGRLLIPLNHVLLAPGEGNRLMVQVTLVTKDVCQPPDAEQAWFLLSRDSEIRLPHRVVDAPPPDLSQYPYPFHADPTLRQTVFALPGMPTAAEISLALRMAASMGNFSGGRVFAPRVFFAGATASEVPGGRHVVVIGRPSRNSLLQDLNAHLPLPFVPGSDEIEQRLNQAIFRLPPDVDLGLVQLFPSPWNAEGMVLALTGTTDGAIAEAVGELTTRPWSFKGNLALVQKGEVATFDTRTLTRGGLVVAVSTAVPVLTPVLTVEVPSVVTPTPSPTPTISVVRPSSSSASPSPPAWLIPFVAITVLVIVGSLGMAFWQARSKK